MTDATARWVALPAHRHWLLKQADGILTLFERASRDHAGGFHMLDVRGRPAADGAPVRLLHLTARAVHCFGIAHLMGRPGADALVDHGMAFLWAGHRDSHHGGYVWSVGPDGPADATKQAYGHAHVLLAAASAKIAGHPDADRLLTDVVDILHQRFWDEARGAAAEEFSRDWQPLGDYRGQNSNMHLAEALMAAHEATGEGAFLTMAERIADLIVRRHALPDGHVIEHFHADWRPDLDYAADPEFRPPGTTPGHSLEWSRLLLQLWHLGGRRLGWLPEAARLLFARAVATGWGPRGGFVYTLDRTHRPAIRARYWWPCCEGIGAAHVLGELDGGVEIEDWYRRIWSFAARAFIDPEHGGWHAEVDDAMRPLTGTFVGKPDIYHSLQACLIPLLPADGSITRGLVRTGIRLEGAPG